MKLLNKKLLLNIFHMYTDSATFHCVRYIGMINLNNLERLFWLSAIAIFFTLVGRIGMTFWIKFDNRPTIVKIADTNLAVSGVTFPAVTLCPANRIKKSLALNYLSRYMNDSIPNKESIMMHVISSLSLLQHPTYSYMGEHLLKANEFLYLFNSLNITDFMIKTLPSCSEVMKDCYWYGNKENCCKMFSLQRTEEGFCYSFNSMLSESRMHCPTYIPPIMMQLDKKLANNGSICSPRISTSSGMYSGLTVVLNQDVSKDRIYNNGSKYEKGVVVMISTCYELPEAGSGMILETLPGETLSVGVKPVIIGTSMKLSKIQKEYRGCSLDQEKPTWIYGFYTYSICLTECRHKYICAKCKCQLYFLHDKSSGYPICTLEQLKCIANLQRTMTLKELDKRIMKCKCTLPCYGTLFAMNVEKYYNSTLFHGKLNSSILEVHFSSKGGTKYNKQMTFTETTLIVSIGSVGNLFLGCSIISFLEVLYYSIRALIICIRSVNKMIIYEIKKILPIYVNNNDVN